MKKYTLLQSIFRGPNTEQLEYIDTLAHTITGDLVVHGPSTSLEIFARVEPVQETLGHLALIRSCSIYGVQYANSTHPDRTAELIFFVDRKNKDPQSSPTIPPAVSTKIDVSFGKTWGEL